MRVFITGACGFAGRHLIHELILHHHEVIAFDLKSAVHDSQSVKTLTGDIQNAEVFNRLINDTRPDACIHLSAISFIPESWLHIDKMFSVNLSGTIHLLEAFRKHVPEAPVLVISSSEVYGRTPRNHRIRENDLLNPDNPYAISKAAADRTALLYADHYGMHTITARPGNHIGPGQSDEFVIASFAKQLSAIAHNKTRPVIQVGNLDSQRDFTDVRDIVRAYRLLIENGKAGQAYNIASGCVSSVRTIFNKLCDLTGVRPDVEIDQKRFRPSIDRPLVDITKIEKEMHWKPEIPLDETLRDIIADLD